MNRLATRLALAMLAVAAISLLVATIGQNIAAVQTFQSLPSAVRTMVERRPFLAPAPAMHDAPAMRERRAAELLAQSTRNALRNFYDELRRLQRRAALAALAVAVALCAVVAYLLARGIAAPIERVSRAASRMAEGDLSARVGDGPGHGPLETRALARDFDRMADALEAGEAERRAMVAAVAHELRTPLSAIQARLEAVIDGLAPFDAAEADRLHRQTELLTRLVEDLRTASLADAGRLELRPRDVDLADLVRDAVAALEPAARRADVTVAVDAPPSLPARLDPDRVRQILANLLDNALRASPDGGTIDVRMGTAEGSLRVEIDDRGPGIADGDLDAIFERFRQGADTRGRSGLGLSVVRALAELHGGAAHAEHRPGGGARLVVTLPSDSTPSL